MKINGQNDQRRLLIVGLAIVGLIAVAIMYRSYQERQRRESTLGAMVVAFQEQNQLTVFRAQVPVFVTSRRDGWVFDSEQFGVIPASIEYRLDLSKLNARNLKWDGDAQKMIVTIPPPVISDPVLDMERAKLVNRGILVTGNIAVELLRKNAQLARRQAQVEANNPQMMKLAREAARKAMVQNVSVPLIAAGYDDTSVAVRFPDEPRADADPSYLDRSLTYNQAIEAARKRRAAEGQR